jgi:hypothetical protein
VFERVIGFIYIRHISTSVPKRTTLTNQNCIQEEIKSRLESWNASEVEIYKNIILPFVLYGCETWPLTLKEERRLRVFENRVLRRIFEPKRNEVTGEWKKTT